MSKINGAPHLAGFRARATPTETFQALAMLAIVGAILRRREEVAGFWLAGFPQETNRREIRVIF
jgi:hypothetical protein